MSSLCASKGQHSVPKRHRRLSPKRKQRFNPCSKRRLDMTTQKKTIALFGAGSGLGASLATRFASEGYRVALVARRPEPLHARVAELAKAGVEAAAFPADLSDVAGIPALVRSIEAHFGSIDVAVYAPLPS